MRHFIHSKNPCRKKIHLISDGCKGRIGGKELLGIESSPVRNAIQFKDVGCRAIHMGVSLNGGTPKSSILIGFSVINHPILGYPYFWKHPYVLWVREKKQVPIENTAIFYGG